MAEQQAHVQEAVHVLADGQKSERIQEGIPAKHSVQTHGSRG